MNIFNISQDYLALIEQLEECEGELTPELEQHLVITEELFEKKCIDYSWAIRYIGADVAVIDDEIKRLQARKKAKEKTIERMKGTVEEAMVMFEKGKIETPTLSVSLRKSESIFIGDETLIPRQFITIKTTETPNKTDIKKAIKAGEDVPGAELIENQNLQIR